MNNIAVTAGPVMRFLSWYYQEQLTRNIFGAQPNTAQDNRVLVRERG